MKQTTHTAGQSTDHGVNMANYVVGFCLSVVLTIVAFLLVTQEVVSGGMGLFIIGSLAILQFTVQVLCFLHLGGETKPRHKQLAFAFMLGVVLILVGGSLWIMNNLDYHMSSHKLNEYLNEQDSL
jgi:cytochrome o ubiquinol oxidase operon protein cyoD